MATAKAYSPVFGRIGKLFLSLLLAICLTPDVRCAETVKEFTVRFHFRLDYAAFESKYMDNAEASEALRSFLDSVSRENLLDARVTAYASPEGNEKYNLELCEIRLVTLRTVIGRHFPQLRDITTYHVGGEDWEALRTRVEADQSLLARSPETYRIITGILEDPALGNDEKKVLLKSRLKENWYGYLRWIHYRPLRVCEVTVRYKEPETEMETPSQAPETVPDTVSIPRADTVYRPQPAAVQPELEELPKEPQPQQEPTVLRPWLALGSNLLYDVALTPNVSLELPIGKHWSLLADYTFPWWVNRQNDRAWQILKGNLGLRYWPGRKSDRQNPYNQLTGHFFGLDAGLGYYDIEPLHTGYQGEFLTAGLEYGYAWRLGEHWRMSTFVAAGWMGTRYRRYAGNDADTRLLYKYDGRFTWIGPTKLGMSVQYVFTRKKKK